MIAHKYTDLPVLPGSLEWLWPIESVRKVEYREMLDKVNSGSWTLWEFEEPLRGAVVTYPERGALFIYYLHGAGLFGRLTSKFLLGVARKEGLRGLRAFCGRPGMVRLLSRLGFTVTDTLPSGWEMELQDGKQ